MHNARLNIMTDLNIVLDLVHEWSVGSHGS